MWYEYINPIGNIIVIEYPSKYDSILHCINKLSYFNRLNSKSPYRMHKYTLILLSQNPYIGIKI